MLNHIRFDFYHNISVKDNIFSRVQLKKALCDKCNGKLANQIGRLVAIVVKMYFSLCWPRFLCLKSLYNTTPTKVFT